MELKRLLILIALCCFGGLLEGGLNASFSGFAALLFKLAIGLDCCVKVALADE
jgi:hypothetical protein